MDSTLQLSGETMGALHQALDVQRTHLLACDPASYNNLPQNTRITFAARVRNILPAASDDMVRAVFLHGQRGLRQGLQRFEDTGVVVPTSSVAGLQQTVGGLQQTVQGLQQTVQEHGNMLHGLQQTVPFTFKHYYSADFVWLARRHELLAAYYHDLAQFVAALAQAPINK